MAGNFASIVWAYQKSCLGRLGDSSDLFFLPGAGELVGLTSLTLGVAVRFTEERCVIWTDL